MELSFSNQFRINMHRSIFILFCVGVVVFSVNCAVDVDSFMEDIIRKTDKMLVKYEQDLDKAVPFKELKASLKALDLMAKDYQGGSKDPIYQATNLGYKATNKYYQATEEIFSWCVKAEVIISYIIENDPDKNLAYKSLLKLSGKGVTAIKKSLDKLNEVRSDLTEMSNKLRPVPSALTKELQELRQQHLETLRNKKILQWGLFAALVLIGAVATIVLSFLTGPIGIAIGITSTVVAAGLPIAVIQGKVLPDEEEKWKITEAYYKSLIQAVNYAQGNVTAVQESLNMEIAQVERLRGSVEGQLDTLEDFPGLPRKSVSILNKFKNTLDDFISRHSGGSSTNHRRRREALSGYHGLDVDTVSSAVDNILNCTAHEREEAFWKLPVLPVSANYFIGDLKYSLV